MSYENTPAHLLPIHLVGFEIPSEASEGRKLEVAPASNTPNAANPQEARPLIRPETTSRTTYPVAHLTVKAAQDPTRATS